MSEAGKPTPRIWAWSKQFFDAVPGILAPPGPEYMEKHMKGPAWVRPVVARFKSLRVRELFGSPDARSRAQEPTRLRLYFLISYEPDGVREAWWLIARDRDGGINLDHYWPDNIDTFTGIAPDLEGLGTNLKVHLGKR